MIKIRKRILAIDPSINTMGVAIFDAKTKALEYFRLHKPEDKTGTEFEKSLSLFYQVKALRTEYGTTHTVLEVPVHWEREGFVARESGSLQKLSIIVGMVYTLGDVHVVPPHGWKKQMPKKVVHRRLMKRYPGVVVETMDHNVVDAIGIGHWYLYGRV